MTLTILYLVFLSFLINFTFSSYLGNRVANLISNFCMFLSLLMILILLKTIVTHNLVLTINLYNLINFEQLSINVTLLFDSLTIIMLTLVMTVSFSTHIYSLEYMLGDPYQNKFISYLSLFTFFMLILVTSNNLIQLFLGWEGIGICSFLLINFWFTRVQALKSAIMAVLVNKIGDIAFIIAIAIAFYAFSTTDINLIIKCATFATGTLKILTKALAILFIIAALSKSAQIGLHIWLPEAMEGPTPVSSLIHAATLVTAGIFLIIRFNTLFIADINIMVAILLIGSLTSFMAASIGLFQNDIKKIIAYSTCSQLGYMFLSCGMNTFNYSIFHLMNHAFFKALLFLTSGYIIHSLMNEQDIRKYGSIINLNKYSYVLILFSSLSLMGFPFLSGFFSKETILLSMFNVYTTDLNNLILYNIIEFSQFLGYLTMFFTAIYSLKLLINTFKNSFNGYKVYIYLYHLSTYLTWLPLLILFVLSIVSGYLFYDLLIGVSTPFWNDSIHIGSRNEQVNLMTLQLININYIYYCHMVHYFTLYAFGYITLVSYIFFISLRETNFHLTINNPTFFIFKVVLMNKYSFFQRSIFIFFKQILSYSYNYIFIYIEKSLLELLGIKFFTRTIFYTQYKISKNDTIYARICIFAFLSVLLFYFFMH